MPNPFYSASGNPGTGSEGLSSLVRGEFLLIQAAFDLMPRITTTGLFDSVFNQMGSYTFTLPGGPGTFALLADVATETTRATAAEGTISTAVGTETTARIAADAVNATAIAAEATARAGAITTEVAARNTAIGVETARATTAEGVNATAISANATAIAAEATTRSAADAAEVTARNAAIGVETTARTSADATLATAAAAAQTTANAAMPKAGTATNDNAAAGQVGEYLTATASSAGLVSGTGALAVSLALTAGDWEVSGNLVFSNGGGATYTRVSGSISTTGAMVFGTISNVDSYGMPAGASPSINTGGARISAAGSVTASLMAQASFTGGSANATGIIQARRMR
jgi:hypothetical protein